MIILPENINDIVEIVSAKFRTFGGNAVDNNNPIAILMQGRPPQFAAGVDVKSVVEEVVKQYNIIQKNQ